MSSKPISRYAILNSVDPGQTSRPSSIPRRSDAILHHSPSGPRAIDSKRCNFSMKNTPEGGLNPSSGSDDNNTNGTLSQRRVSQAGPTMSTITTRSRNEELPSHEAALLLAIYTEKANVERVHRGAAPWSSLDSDFAALELMIVEHITNKDRVEDGLSIIQKLFLITPGGSQERTLMDLREFLLSSHCNMTTTEVEAVLIFACRVAEHFRPSKPFLTAREITTQEPVETFNHMDTEYAREADDRGRTSRRASLSRAAGVVKDSVKEGIRRLSRTRRVDSPRRDDRSRSTQPH